MTPLGEAFARLVIDYGERVSRLALKLGGC